MATVYSVTVEEWRPVPDYEEQYIISNLGRIRGLDRLDSIGRRVQGRVMRPHVKSDWTTKILLSKEAIGTNFSVHILVMRAFVGQTPDGQYIAHKDGNLQNNRLDNLEYRQREHRKLIEMNATAYDYNRAGIIAFKLSGLSDEDADRIKRLATKLSNECVPLRIAVFEFGDESDDG